MLSRHQLHPYQVRAVEHIKANPQAMLWLDIGLGKTISTLTALSDLIAEGKIYGVLILAPLRVCQTVWEQEAGKWSHTSHLSFSLIHGNLNHRKRAIRKRRMVYLLNYEGLPSAKVELINAYMAKGRPLPFNCVVFDESTMVKSARIQQGGKRAAALQFLLDYIPYRIGLTGTPSPNGLLDLFGQYLVLNNGYSLGQSYTHYRQSYFVPDQGGYRYFPTAQGKEIIYNRISPITLQMSAKDYLDLPPVTYNNIEVDLPQAVRQKYETLEHEAFVVLDTGVPIEAPNAAAVIGKCLQFANGAVYHTPKDPAWEHLHDNKLDALFDIIEELGGNPLLVGYQFKHDAQRIKTAADKRGIENVIINSKVKKRDMKVIVNKWNAGVLPLMIGHGKSMGHGLNLQQSAHHVAWFGLPWSRELFEQLNGRIARQGQRSPVIVHQLLTRKTFDYAVLEAQQTKAKTETELKAAIAAYRRTKQ